MFTTIAAAASLAATAASTGGSFIQAGKQRRNQLKAEADAAKAMAEARKRLSVNVYKGLGIAKEPYELEREAMLSAGAQALQAGQESERGAAATAGRIQMAQQEQQDGTRTAMGKEIQDLNKLVATEEGRLLDFGAALNLQEVEGAQLAARDAAEARNQAITQGMQGIQSLGGQLASMAPLYEKSSSVKMGEKIGKELGKNDYYAPLDKPMWARTGAEMNDPVSAIQLNTPQQYLQAVGGNFGLDVSGLSGMNQNQFNSWLSQVDPSTLRRIFKGM